MARWVNCGRADAKGALVAGERRPNLAAVIHRRRPTELCNASPVAPGARWRTGCMSERNDIAEDWVRDRQRNNPPFVLLECAESNRCAFFVNAYSFQHRTLL